MNYLIDFDHTLLDTEALKAKAFADGSSALAGQPEFWEHHVVTEFLFPDVLPWLQTKPKESLHILTAFKPSQGPQAKAFQEGKLQSGGIGDLFSSVTVIEGLKGEVAADIAKSFQSPTPLVFIDDRLDQCFSVKLHLPQAYCFLMVRYQVCPPAIPAGITPVYSLAEVDAIMNATL